MSSNIVVIVEAKKQYTKQLKLILTEHIFDGITSIYQDSLNPELGKNFQQLLRDIPKWNQDIIDLEYNRVCELSKCDYLDDILRSIFIAHSKILTSIQSIDSKLQLNIPTGKVFIHKVYACVSKFAYWNPNLFDVSANVSKKLKNKQKVLEGIKECIDNTILKLAPIRDIVKQNENKSHATNEYSQDTLEDFEEEEEYNPEQEHEQEQEQEDYESDLEPEKPEEPEPEEPEPEPKTEEEHFMDVISNTKEVPKDVKSISVILPDNVKTERFMKNEEESKSFSFF